MRAELDEFKEIKDALGGTVNDVVLAVVAGGLAHFLRRARHRHGGHGAARVRPGLDPQRTTSEGALGNEITIMMAPLPVGIADPTARLQRVREVMDGLKESKQALGAKAISNLQDFAPPTIFAQASRLNFSSRMYNLLVTNVPGPQFPLYVLGRRMSDIFPVPFLAGDALAGDRDHVLRRRDELRPARRLRRDARPRRRGRGDRGRARRARLIAGRRQRIEQRKAKRRAPAKPRAEPG